ncbi:group I intron-associated PD-(D/E)XK endonuclease [Sporichthya brevicatena]|uniref:group I intron-associated PD-(D/E)XK endonuclease n=1 Tax=Sporichthya brevicatena TaxID=171442 RepID=UPI0031D389FA
MNATSGAMIRSVRAHADRLKLDYSHFRGHRGWSDADLQAAVACARDWSEVGARLGLVGGSSQSTLVRHATRLGLDVTRLGAPERGKPLELALSVNPDHLPRAGSMLAAAWFTLRGCDVAWPLEPCRYDLLVTMSGAVNRIQVKTTRLRAGQTWRISLSSSRKGVPTYDTDEIDYFFAIDGVLNFYLIPVAEVGGLHAIHLASYSAFRVEGLLPPPAPDHGPSAAA